MLTSATSDSLACASTLPSRYCLDAAILEQEKQRVFGATWQLVARADDVAPPGDFMPSTVVDEPIVTRNASYFIGLVIAAGKRR